MNGKGSRPRSNFSRQFRKRGKKFKVDDFDLTEFIHDDRFDTKGKITDVKFTYLNTKDLEGLFDKPKRKKK